MLHNKRFSKISLNMIVICISIISYIAYLLIYFNLDRYGDQNDAIFVLSWLGIFSGIYIIITWYKLTGCIFSLYTIFMLFFFLFNYGQPLMWSIGIHQYKEIGQTSLYTLGIPTSAEVVLSQAISLISIILFHFGAMFSYKGKRIPAIKRESCNVSIKNNKTITAIYKTSFFLIFLVIPVTFYNLIYKFMISRIYGYRAFYYNDEVVNNIVVFNLISNMFFPCLVGLLIGSKYKKKVRISVYAIFTIYILISLLSGDRGTWIYKLLILIWMSHTFYKPLNFKKFVKYIISGLFGLYIIDAIVAVRNIGVTFQNIINSFSLKESAIISAVFEMGRSMRPTVVLMKYGWDIWPYGNTYVNALLGMVTSRTMTIIGRPFEPVSDWFSQSYLGISYGAGFSIVAEPLLNFGPIFAPIFMILLGYIITSFTYLDKNINIERQPLKIFFAVTTMAFFIAVVRNHFLWVVKSWFYGVIVFLVLILMVRDYIGRKS